MRDRNISADLVGLTKNYWIMKGASKDEETNYTHIWKEEEIGENKNNININIEDEGSKNDEYTVYG